MGPSFSKSKLTVESTTDMVIKSIISTTQQNASSNQISQIVDIDSTQQLLAYNSCVNDFIENRKNTGESSEVIAESAIKLCEPLLKSIDEININSLFVVKDRSEQLSTLSQEQIDKIANDIQSKQSQENSGFTIGNEVKTFIKNKLNINKEIIVKSLQELSSNNSVVQSVTIRSGLVKLIALESSVEIVKNTLMRNETFVKSMSDINNKIVTENSQVNKSNITEILYLIFGIAIVFLIVIFGYVIALRYKKNIEISRMKEYKSIFGSDFQEKWDKYVSSLNRKFLLFSIISIIIVIGLLYAFITYIIKNT